MSADTLAELTELPRMTIFNARKSKNITIMNAIRIATVLEVPLENIWQTESSTETTSLIPTT